MSAFRRFIQAAAVAVVAVSALCAAGAASAEVQMARSECIKGFWHVRTYDITNPEKWVLIEDKATEQPCNVPQLPVPGAEAMTTPSLNATYHFEPKWDLRPQLRYQWEERQREQERQQRFHLSPRYAF
jgi:hypothetical protein